MESQHGEKQLGSEAATVRADALVASHERVEELREQMAQRDKRVVAVSQVAQERAGRETDARQAVEAIFGTWEKADLSSEVYDFDTMELGESGNVEFASADEAPVPEATEEPEAPQRGWRSWARRARSFISRRSEPVEASWGAPEPIDLRYYNYGLMTEGGKIGKRIREFYDVALDLVPELAEVEVLPLPLSEERHLFFASGRNGQAHAINIRLDDSTVGLMETWMRDFPATQERIAETIGMTKEELDERPDIAVLFGTIHELGHTKQFLSMDRETYLAQSRADMATLPVPNTPVLHLTKPEAQQYIKDNWQVLQQKYGVRNFEELSLVQQNAYRSIRREAVPDKFAQQVFNEYRRRFGEI